MMRKVKIDFFNIKGELVQGVNFSGGNDAETHMLGYAITVKDGYKRVPIETAHEMDNFKVRIQFVQGEEIEAETTVYGSDATIWLHGKTVIIRREQSC